VHSDFGVLVKSVKPTSANDQVLIQRAKSRYAYWTRGNTVIFWWSMIQIFNVQQTIMNNFLYQVRCCTLDRKRQTQPTTYGLPSCWPTVVESDVDELSNAFSKF